MKIGLIDVDAESRKKVTFPNLALMKLSAYHKSIGDDVMWYDPSDPEEYDLVYMSKIFGEEYTKDYPHPVNAKRIVRGGLDMLSKCRTEPKHLSRVLTAAYQMRWNTSRLTMRYMT